MRQLKKEARYNPELAARSFRKQTDRSPILETQNPAIDDSAQLKTVIQRIVWLGNYEMFCQELSLSVDFVEFYRL